MFVQINQILTLLLFVFSLSYIVDLTKINIKSINTYEYVSWGCCEITGTLESDSMGLQGNWCSKITSKLCVGYVELVFDLTCPKLVPMVHSVNSNIPVMANKIKDK